MDKIGRNDPCPCGSGKKYKRCCLDQNASPVGFTSDERRLALEKLDRFVETKLGAEDDEAWESFFEFWTDQLEELNDQETQISEDFYDAWFLWDCAPADGWRAVDRFLEEGPLLSPGERHYLRLMRETAVRLYEVVDVSPGESVTLVELASGAQAQVREKTASRSLVRGALLAARIIERGASGRPEIEFGLLSISELVRDQVLSQLSNQCENYRAEYPEATDLDVLKAAAPVFHDVWISTVLDPPIPRLQNTDGEDLLTTRVRFEVADPARAQAAFDNAEGLEREGEGKPVWLWSGGNLKGNPIILGRLVLEENALELECNSAERAGRGRTLIETLAGDSVGHRSTIHENVVMDIRERLRSRRHESTDADPGGTLAGEGIPREAQEALTLDALARHYREWLDLPIPALNDRSPREAAGDSGLRGKLAKLIRRLEGAYQGCLQADKPAYDPSWMWGELGLEDRSRPIHPPLLAHERMASLVPGLGGLCRTVAENARRQPGFKDASSILTPADIRRNLDIQRFLRHREADLDDQNSAPGEQVIPSLEPYIYLMTNLELHRRKTFWVDESLAYMLAKTELDVSGGELRAPFPCFALVFSDRYTLSLAERLLARDRQCPIAGYYLKAATTYVVEERLESGRGLRVVFALDTLGADPPHLAEYNVPLTEEAQIKSFLDGLGGPPPRLVAESEIPDANPLRALFHLVFCSILYATSAGVAPEVRDSPAGAPKGGRRGAGEPPVFSSESVFFLPGPIEISRVREFEELERVSSGKRILHRFMVRGHWRRAAAGWKDQRLRWIEPYWKGPDIAAVIERAYKLKP